MKVNCQLVIKIKLNNYVQKYDIKKNIKNPNEVRTLEAYQKNCLQMKNMTTECTSKIISAHWLYI